MNTKQSNTDETSPDQQIVRLPKATRQMLETLAAYLTYGKFLEYVSEHSGTDLFFVQTLYDGMCNWLDSLPQPDGTNSTMLYDSLRRVLEYIEENERNDFESSPDEEREQHIYRDVHVIKTWFERDIRYREADEG